MDGWPKLDPAQQKEVLDQLTITLLEALPEDWQRLVIEYRVLGRHSDARIGIYGPDGSIRKWDPPLEAWHRFQDLRHGMYAEGEGTWFSAQYVLERPDKFSVQYNWDMEPNYNRQPPLEQILVEQERFPRVEGHMPDWYRAKLAQATAAN